MSNAAGAARIDTTQAAAYAMARRNGAADALAKDIADRARREAASDERNGRLFAGAGTVIAYESGRFGIYTYTGRIVDPLDTGLAAASSLD